MKIWKWRLATQVFYCKDFFSSWTDALCFFSVPFSEKLLSQILHWKVWKCFFLPWTDAMCFLVVPFVLNKNYKYCTFKGFISFMDWSFVLAQELYWKGFFPSWTDVTCLFKSAMLAKEAMQVLQWKDLFALWTIQLFVFKHWFLDKEKSQIVDSNGFFSPWTKDSCTSKSTLFTKLAPQILHSKGFCLSWTLIFEIYLSAEQSITVKYFTTIQHEINILGVTTE